MEIQLHSNGSDKKHTGVSASSTAARTIRLHMAMRALKLVRYNSSSLIRRYGINVLRLSHNVATWRPSTTIRFKRVETLCTGADLDPHIVDVHGPPNGPGEGPPWEQRMTTRFSKYGKPANHLRYSNPLRWRGAQISSCIEASDRFKQGVAKWRISVRPISPLTKIESTSLAPIRNEIGDAFRLGGRPLLRLLGRLAAFVATKPLQPIVARVRLATEIFLTLSGLLGYGCIIPQAHAC